MTLTTRDLFMTVSLTEEESRFLAFLILWLASEHEEDLTEMQRQAAVRISQKCGLAIDARRARLIDHYGRAAFDRVVQEQLRAYPDEQITVLHLD